MSGLNAQNIEVKGYLGATYYLGDLAPQPIALSFTEGNLAWSLSVGTKLSDVFSLHAKYTLGKIGGDDGNASTIGRRERNLSFQSPLREFAVVTEININHWLTGLDKYGINIYYSTGIAVFNFDPQTIYKNQAVRLQPLGTEGQGLPGYDEKYSLYQVSIPFGLGLSFNFNTRLKFSFEVVPRVTFTDYIDDVSKAYVSTQELVDAGKLLTADLANRTGEFQGNTRVDYVTGSLRGNANDNDWYFFSGISLSYTFGKMEKKVIDILPQEEEILEAPDSKSQEQPKDKE